jgi:hypothetical protein
MKYGPDRVWGQPYERTMAALLRRPMRVEELVKI